MAEPTNLPDGGALAQYVADQLSQDSGIVLAHVVEFDIEEFLRTWRHLGHGICQTREGDYSFVMAGGAPGDFSRTAQDFDFHTDGLYHEQLPRFVLLHCINPGDHLCKTHISDTNRAFESMSTMWKEMATLVEGVYIGREGDEYSRAIVSSHPSSGIPVLTMPSRGYIRPAGLNPSLGAQITVRDIASLTDALLDGLEEATVMRRGWEAGGVLVFDNLKYMHARRCIDAGDDRARCLHRVWLS